MCSGPINGIPLIHFPSSRNYLRSNGMVGQQYLVCNSHSERSSGEYKAVTHRAMCLHPIHWETAWYTLSHYQKDSISATAFWDASLNVTSRIQGVRPCSAGPFMADL